MAIFNEHSSPARRTAGKPSGVTARMSEQVNSNTAPKNPELFGAKLEYAFDPKVAAAELASKSRVLKASLLRLEQSKAVSQATLQIEFSV